MATKGSDVLAEIKRAFAAADADGNGVITPDELFGLMKMLKKGQNPTEEEVKAIGQKMDKNGDGQISEEEFTECMLAWLQTADTPVQKRRRASTDDESPNVRKRVHQQIASFFRNTGVRPDYAQLQQRILERGTDELDMDSWRNSFQVPTPQMKAALLEECRRIKEGGRESMQWKLHAADSAVCLEGAVEVQTLLSLVEFFPSAAEREELAYELLEAFEGVTILSNPPVLGSDGRPLMPIVHRLCVLLDDSVATQIQIVACRALYYFTIGPRVPHTSPNSHWHPDHMWSKQLVVSQNLPTRLLHIIRSTTGSSLTKTPEQLELLEQAVRCAGAFAEHDREALDLVLQMNIRQALLEVLKQNPPLGVIRACTYALSVCCGHTHSHHLEQDLQPLHLTKEEMEEITMLCDTVLREVSDEAAVCNAVLILRSILPLWDPILHQMNVLLVQLIQAEWATAIGGKFTVIMILFCLQEVLSMSVEATRALFAETDLSTILFNQLGMGSEHPQIASAALGIIDVMIQHHLYDELTDSSRGFVRQLIALVQGTDLSLQKRAIRTLRELSTHGRHLTAAVINAGGVEATSRLFQSFKQHDNVLADVYGYLGASYNVDLVSAAVETLTNMLTNLKNARDVTAQEVGAFNLNLVERVSQLHGVFVQEMSKSRLYPSDDLVELCTALYRMLEQTVELHTATSSSIAAAIKTSCDELMTGWDEALTNAFNTGSQETNSAEMDILPAGHASVFHESTGPLLNARGIPQWNTGEGKDVRVAQVPEHAKWTELRNYFTAMYGMPVLCQVEDHATQEKITVDRQEVWDEFVAHHLKTKRDEPLRIYLLLANSKFSNGQSVATHPGSFGDALELGPKSMELKKLRGLGIQFNPKLMSDVYDYYKAKGKQAINLQEFIEAMSTGPSPICTAEDAVQLFSSFDFDGNGELSFTEVATGLSVIMSGTLDERLFCAFKAFDEDGNGNLDVHEVAKLLQASGFSLETALMGAQDVFKNADKDGNGLLSFDEFKAAVMGSRIMLSAFWTTGLPGLQGYQQQQHQQSQGQQHSQQHSQDRRNDHRNGGRQQSYGGRGRGRGNGRGGNRGGNGGGDLAPPQLQRQHNTGQQYPRQWRSGPSPFGRR